MRHNSTKFPVELRYIPLHINDQQSIRSQVNRRFKEGVGRLQILLSLCAITNFTFRAKSFPFVDYQPGLPRLLDFY